MVFLREKDKQAITVIKYDQQTCRLVVYRYNNERKYMSYETENVSKFFAHFTHIPFKVYGKCMKLEEKDRCVLHCQAAFGVPLTTRLPVGYMF